MGKIPWETEKIWNGCMLTSIAHAIMVAHHPELSHEHSWDGFTYNMQDSSGARGTITFHPSYLIAAFRDDNNKRASNYKNALEFFKDAPEEVKELAIEETLQYLLENVNGEVVVPVITTAFWGRGKELYSQEELDEMVENGGFLLEKQTMDIETAINEWQEDYEMSKRQINLLKSIFQRKISDPLEIIVLTEQEVQMIESEDQESLAESRISFKEIGIEWEM